MSDGLGFVFNAGVMGISGDQRRKFFRNGDHGRGRGSQDRRDLPTAPWSGKRVPRRGAEQILRRALWHREGKIIVRSAQDGGMTSMKYMNSKPYDYRIVATMF